MRDEVALAGAAARAAAAVVLKYYGGDYAVRDKGAIDTPAGLVDNPVTSADLEADALLREMLHQLNVNPGCRQGFILSIGIALLHPFFRTNRNSDVFGRRSAGGGDTVGSRFRGCRCIH